MIFKRKKTTKEKEIDTSSLMYKKGQEIGKKIAGRIVRINQLGNKNPKLTGILLLVVMTVLIIISTTYSFTKRSSSIPSPTITPVPLFDTKPVESLQKGIDAEFMEMERLYNEAEELLKKGLSTKEDTLRLEDLLFRLEILSTIMEENESNEAVKEETK